MKACGSGYMSPAARSGRAGRDLVVATATWDVRLDALLDAPAFTAARVRLQT